MAGNRLGGLKASAANKAKYGEDFYKIQGAKGGRAGHSGGFASMTPEKRSECGRKGGKMSRRTKANREIYDAREAEIEEMYLIDGASYAEIARTIGVTYGAMRRYLLDTYGQRED